MSLINKRKCQFCNTFDNVENLLKDNGTIGHKDCFQKYQYNYTN